MKGEKIGEIGTYKIVLRVKLKEWELVINSTRKAKVEKEKSVLSSMLVF